MSANGHASKMTRSCMTLLVMAANRVSVVLDLGRYQFCVNACVVDSCLEHVRFTFNPSMDLLFPHIMTIVKSWLRTSGNHWNAIVALPKTLWHPYKVERR